MAIVGSSSEVGGYLDLRMKLRSRGHNRLGVDMRFGDATRLDEEFTFPVSLDRVEQALAAIWNASDQRPVRKGATTSLDPAVDLGLQIFTALFAGQREAFYRQVQEAANASGQGLRLAFSLADREAAALPWELLYNGRDFVALSTRSPLVRCVERGQEPLPPPQTGVRILAAIADMEFSKGRWGEMTRALYDRLRKDFSQLQVEIIENTTLEQLNQALQANYDIVHICGHATKVRSGAQALHLLDEERRPVLIEPDQLARVLDRKEIRLICLDACNSDLLAYDLARMNQTLAIYGIQSTISDNAADHFAEGFLSAVLSGQPLTACVTQGRQYIDSRRPGSREWALPVLYTGSPDGQIVLAPWQIGIDVSSREISKQVAVGEASAARRKQPVEGSPERQRLQMWITLNRKNLEALETQLAVANYAPAQLPEQIAGLRTEIAALEEKLAHMA